MNVYFYPLIVSQFTHRTLFVLIFSCNENTKNLYTISIEIFITPFMIPMVGVEPTLPKEHDFESCASANSATSAQKKGGNRI